ncbi:hypothetical protein ACK2FX_18195 [Clostridioides difficile]
MISQNEIDILTHSLPFWDKLTDLQKELLISSANTSDYKKGIQYIVVIVTVLVF